MARLGFNVVRLGMTWSGLEPGTAPANDPAICGRGTPTNPHQFNQAVFDRYVHRLRDDRRPARPVPHLHDPRHAPGRLQRDVRRRGCAELGGVHERRAERRPARALVARVRAPGRPASPSATSGPTTSAATSRASTTASGVTWPAPSAATRGSSATTPSTSPSPRRWSASVTPISTRSSSASTPARPTSALPSHGAPALRCPTQRPDRRCRPHDPGQRPLPPDLRRARQLRQPWLPHLPGTDGPAQPRLQRAHLLRRPQPGHRQPDERGASAPARRRTPWTCGPRTARRWPRRPARRAGVVRHRVRRHQQRRASGEHHGPDGRAAGRVGLLGLEVLRRSRPEAATSRS